MLIQGPSRSGSACLVDGWRLKRTPALLGHVIRALARCSSAASNFPAALSAAYISCTQFEPCSAPAAARMRSGITGKTAGRSDGKPAKIARHGTSLSVVRKQTL